MWRVAAPATNSPSPTLARRRARAWIADPASSRGLLHDSLQSPAGSYAEMRDVRTLVAARAKTLCEPIAVEGRSFDRVDEIVSEI